ncbi:MAG: pentapeptide repeat-containing protein [Propionibacteriaceae bacterium]|jgi:uncharacterized protein YjbI with pentapeptide repeats|nr:pentapeptide repeat-containing protein [Propionibacteriaceae bacterium]
MLNTTIIGQRIMDARKNRNLSQAGLGDLLSISSQAVGKWERGESMPDIITFNRIAQVLGVDLNYFSEQGSAAFPGAGNTGDSGFHLELTDIDPADSRERNQAPGLDMSSAIWRDADFSGLSNLNGKFSGSNIANCKFVGADLCETVFSGNSIKNCDFSQANLSSGRLSSSNIRNSTFANASLVATQFRASGLVANDFSGADFSDAKFRASAFASNVIVGAIWNRVEWKASNFIDIVFTGELADCSFVNCKFSKVRFQGVNLRNCFFKNGNLKKIVFEDCQADGLTYAFLKNSHVDVSGIAILPPAQ